MNRYTQKGYLFMQSFDLDEDEIRNHLVSKIDKLDTDIKPYRLFINVVSNKDEVKQGFTYIWTDSDKVYNLFCGLNLNGSERIEYYDDPDWKPSEEKDMSEITDWSVLAEEEDNKVCPQLKKVLPPLTDISYCDKIEKITKIGPLCVDKLGKNILFSKNVEPWITENIIRKHLQFFEKDKTKYRNHRTGKFYQYPIISINKNEKRGNILTVIFSQRNPNTASFLIHIVKKLMVRHKDKEKLIFFSQSKN